MLQWLAWFQRSTQDQLVDICGIIRVSHGSRKLLNIISPLNHLQGESIFPDILIYKIEASCSVMLNCCGLSSRVRKPRSVLFLLLVLLSLVLISLMNSKQIVSLSHIASDDFLLREGHFGTTLNEKIPTSSKSPLHSS